ncbi:MAG: hypothetical protein ACJATN_001423 [Neolewinella sp.]|jgi:hypothetical protein
MGYAGLKSATDHCYIEGCCNTVKRHSSLGNKSSLNFELLWRAKCSEKELPLLNCLVKAYCLRKHYALFVTYWFFYSKNNLC